MFAGAAFTDAADIKQTEAVDMLTALGVIDGYEDGSFRPDATVTRAEAAKMIYTIRNGGNSNADAFKDGATSFTDLTDDWYKGYVKYCQALGIIAGKSTTSFDPNGTVTGTELAKMLLVTLGYDPEVAGLEGSAWAQKTLALASENGLLDDVTVSLSAACPRQFAAQIMYNAINADIVVLKDGKYQKVETTVTEPYLVYDKNGNGNYDQPDDVMSTKQVTKNKTLGNAYMDLNESSAFVLTSVKEDNKGTYSLNGSSYTKVATDYSDLLGQEVKVLYKDTDDVYGVYATTNNTVYETTVGDLEDKDTKIKFNGTEYKTDGDDAGALPVLSVNNGTYTRATVNDLITNKVADKSSAYTVRLIDSTGDDKIDRVIVFPMSIAEVTYVGTKSITAGGVYKFEDDVIYDGVAKDDFAVIVAKANTSADKNTLTKADVVTGKITGTKGSGASTEFAIDGTWYKLLDTTYASTALNSKVTIAVYNGYIFNLEVNASGSTDFALVTKLASWTSVESDAPYQAKVIFADGSTEVVPSEMIENDGDAQFDDVSSITPETGLLCTYEVKKGVYNFTEVQAANYTDEDADGYVGTTGFDQYKDKALKNSGSMVAYIADDAVVFVTAKNGTDASFKVMTGAEVKAWGDTARAATGTALMQKSSGYDYAKVIDLKLTGAIPNGAASTYGYVVEDSTKESFNEDGSTNTYTMVKIWNGTEEITLKEEGTSNTYAKKDIVKYELNADGTAEVDKLVVATGAITAYSADTGDIKIDLAFTAPNASEPNAGSATAYEITDDTVVISVDSSVPEGANGATIQTYTQALVGGTNKYVPNVIVYDDPSTDYVELLIVDIANYIQ